MTGIQFIASVVATGRLHGVGIGSSADEIDRAIHVDFIEEADGNNSLRRDYGLIEFHFSGGPNWVLVGGVIELHRLASNPAMAEEWNQEMMVDFPRYMTWSDVGVELSNTPVPPTLNLVGQGDFLEYHAPDTRVTVAVVDNQDERDDWPGHGDVWSVSLS